MDVEPVREHQCRAVLHVAVQVVAVDVGLQFVRREHHHHVGPLGGLGHLEHLELLALGLLGAAGALAQRDRDLLDAGIPQVEGMGMPLAAVADDGDLLALDQVHVGVPVVIYAHACSPFSASAAARKLSVGNRNSEQGGEPTLDLAQNVAWQTTDIA